MIDERYIELMNNEIDGRNTPAQSEALRGDLENDPKARRLFAELEKTTQLIGESEEVEPPADMQQRIGDLLKEKKKKKHISRAWPETGARARCRRFGSFLRPAPAWAFAAGLVVGLLTYVAFDTMWHGTPAPEQLRGDLGFHMRASADLQGSPWHVKGFGFAGTITAYRVEGRLVVRLTGTAGSDTRFVVVHDGDPSGIVYRTLAGSAAVLRTAPGHATVAFVGTGDHVVELIGDRLATAGLTLRIETEGRQREHVFGPSRP